MMNLRQALFFLFIVSLPLSISAQNDVWMSNGPYGGNVRTIALDKSNESIIYLGLETAGVWKSIDAGATWNPVNQGLPDLRVQVAKVDPVLNNVVYVGTRYGGFYKSTDGGNTWRESNA